MESSCFTAASTVCGCAYNMKDKCEIVSDMKIDVFAYHRPISPALRGWEFVRAFRASDLCSISTCPDHVRSESIQTADLWM